MFNPFTGLNLTHNHILPQLNTGTMKDMATGQYIPGLNGSTILDGGVARTNGTQGWQNKFKSTTGDSDGLNAWARYPGSQYLKWDNEGHAQRHRMVRMINIDFDQSRLPDIIIQTKTELPNIEDFYNLMLTVAERKVKHLKDLIVEAPILDMATGKPARMIIPTIVHLDSLSNAASSATDEMTNVERKIDDEGNIIAKQSVSGSEANRLALLEGKAKKTIVKELDRISARAGIYFIVTAQLGNKVDLSFMPTPKQMQFMKQSDKVKGVGSDYLYLMINHYENTTASILETDKNVMYPIPGAIIGGKDLNYVEQTIIKCKSNAAGSRCGYVISQTDGIDTNLTNYHYLKTMGMYGLSGSPVKHTCDLYPDTVLGRTTIASITRRDARLNRALELIAQLCYIQHNWTIRDMVVPFDIHPNDLFLALNKSSYAVSDILDSRGWWTYDKTNLQPYLSLFDVLAIVAGKYKPTMFQAKTVGVTEAAA